MTPAGVAPGAPVRHKRAADGGQVADGNERSPARRGCIGGTAKWSAEVSPRRAMPPDTSELDDSVDTTPARDDAARTAQVGAADEDEAVDSLQGTDLISMMEEAGAEDEELGDSTDTTPAHDDATEADLERQRLAQPTKKQGKQQRKRAAAAKAKAQFQGSDVHEMLGGDDEGEAVELEGTPQQREAAPELTAKQAKKARRREKQRKGASKSRAAQPMQNADRSEDTAMSQTGSERS